MSRTLIFVVMVLGWMPIGFAEAETVARSQDLRPNSPITKYMASHPSVERMYEIGTSADRDLERVCSQGPYNVEPISFHIVRPVTLAKGATHPDAGVWVARFRFDRCGESFVYNALMFARQGQPPEAGLFVPGETSADPVVFRDMKEPLAAITMLGADKATGKSCTDNTTLKIEHTTAPVAQENVVLPDGRRDRVMNEIWTMRACGATVPVKVQFFRHPTLPGISFRMSLD